MTKSVRGDGVGIEIAGAIIRGVSLRHDVGGRVAGVSELDFDPASDDSAVLDRFTRVRAELGAPNTPTRIAMFPAGSMLQRLDVTGRSGPELNDIRAQLDEDYGIGASMLLDDGPRRWMLIVRWDTTLARRLENLAERAGFVDVAIDPAPVAIGRTIDDAATYVYRVASPGDAYHIAFTNRIPVAASTTDPTGHVSPALSQSTAEFPLQRFDDMLSDALLAQQLGRLSASIQPVAATLRLGDAAYPDYPPHDLRTASRQVVALGAAIGAAGLAGSIRPVDMVLPLAVVPDTERPWAVERLSDLPDVPDAQPAGSLKRMTARLRPRRRR